MVLTPGEIRILLEGLKIRERTLVFIAASTGIRQSELFALKWGDIDLSAGTMNVARSIVHSFVGPCKTESSQKPVPIHPRVCEALASGKNSPRTNSQKTGSLQAGIAMESNRIGDKQFCTSI